jgi:hypothetical protein
MILPHQNVCKIKMFYDKFVKNVVHILNQSNLKGGLLWEYIYSIHQIKPIHFNYHVSFNIILLHNIYIYIFTSFLRAVKYDGYLKLGIKIYVLSYVFIPNITTRNKIFIVFTHLKHVDSR